MNKLLVEIFSGHKKPCHTELEHAVREIKKFQKNHPNTKDQGYYDRLQRASSWLAKAKKTGADPEAKFIYLWIALNAMCGIRQEVLGTDWWKAEIRSLHQLNRTQSDDKVSGELEWFLWRICGLDIGGKTLRSVIEDCWPDIDSVLMSRYIMSFYWNGSWRTEADINKRRDASLGIAKVAIGLASDREKVFQALCEIVIWRLRTLRNQLFHGCATDVHSKRRGAGESEIEAGSRLLEDLNWSFLVLMASASGREMYWPPTPYPRVGSPQHKPLDVSWLPK